MPAKASAESVTLDCWFDFASNYSYLSVLRIEAAAAQRGVRVAWRPFTLGPVFRSLGWTSSPFELQAAKGRYVWQHDMARQCIKHGLPVVRQRPGVFPRAGLLPLRVALFGADRQADWTGEFCRRVMRRNFVEDRDIEGPEAVAEVLTSMGLPAQPLIEAATAGAQQHRLREQTAQAAAQGIFGAPTFFVGEAMFWGDDRLDDAIALARASMRRPDVGTL